MRALAGSAAFQQPHTESTMQQGAYSLSVRTTRLARDGDIHLRKLEEYPARVGKSHALSSASMTLQNSSRTDPFKDCSATMVVLS